MQVSPNLTDAHEGDMQVKINETYEGQAAWAGGGPQGKTCRGCKHWECKGHFASGAKVNQLKDAPCKKYQSLSRRSKVEKFPHSAKACRFFLGLSVGEEARPLHKKTYNAAES